MLVTVANVQALQNGFDARFQTGYKSRTTFHEKIAFDSPTDAKQVVYGWINTIPRARQWVGPRQFNSVSELSTTVTVKDWEDSLEIYRNDVLDDRLGILAPVIEMLGIEAKVLDDQLVSASIRNSGNLLGFDNTTVFSTSHPISVGQPLLGVQSNSFTGMPLNATNYALGLQLFASLLAADGSPFGHMATVTLVPETLKYIARSIIHPDSIAVGVAAGSPAGSPGGAAAQGNVGYLQNTTEVVSTPWLNGDPATWYLVCTNLPVKPYVNTLRQAPQTVQLISPNDQNVFLNKKFWYGWDSRSTVDPALWFLIMKFSP